MNWLLRLSIAFFTAALVAPVHAASDRIALVIGNGAYVHTAHLPNPENDAHEVAKAMTDIGFKVFQHLDLNRELMNEAIRTFLEQAPAAHILVVFYAGHGIQINGRNYMVPVDAKLDTADAVKTELIEVDNLVPAQKSAKRAIVIILDACRDNPLAENLSRVAGPLRSMPIPRGLAAYSSATSTGFQNGTGVLIAFSTAPGNVALDGKGPNSPYTMALIKNMRRHLEIRQMLTLVRADVASATQEQQIPWDNSSLLGDVYLAGAPSSLSLPLRPTKKPRQAPSPGRINTDTTKAKNETLRAPLNQ